MSRLREHEFQADELMAYLDGELEAQRAAELVAHMNHCAECQSMAKEFRQISERMLDFQVQAAPEKIGEVVRAAVAESDVDAKKEAEEPRGVRIWRRMFARPHGWAVAGAIVAAVSLAVWMNNGQGRSQHSADHTGGARAERETSTSTISPQAAAMKSLEADKSSGSSSGQGLNEFTRLENYAAAFTPPPKPLPATEAAVLQQPMIARTASLTITAANYDQANAALQNLATVHGGYVQQMSAEAETSSSRSVSATLRVPASQLSGALADLRKLGHVEEEKQDNAEVTDEYVDVDARLRNARATEQRLIDLLATRTGKLDDVLDVERELASVRGNIESMDAQRTLLLHRVDYATVSVQLNEQYKERLNSDSIGTGTRIWNALVAGMRYLMEGVLGGVEFLLTYGPSIVFWSLLILVPAWFLSRRYGWLGRR